MNHVGVYLLPFIRLELLLCWMHSTAHAADRDGMHVTFLTFLGAILSGEPANTDGFSSKVPVFMGRAALMQFYEELGPAQQTCAVV